MSFVVNDITFYTPGDFDIIQGASIAGLIAYSGNTLYRLEKATIAQSHLHYRLYNNVVNQELKLNSDGSIDIKVTGELRLNTTSASQKYTSTGGSFLFQGTGSSYVQFYNTKPVRTWPPGNSAAMYADSFVVWSSRALKVGVSPIIDAIGKLKAISSKKYTLKDEVKEKVGFIMEECPLEAIESHYDESSGQVVGGVDTMYFIGILWESLKEILTRLENLEKKAK